MELRLEHLPCRIDCDVVVPSFLDDADHPWLQRLVERASASEGLRANDVEEHLMAPLPLPAPPAKQRLAAFMLTKLLETKTAAPVVPREARAALFVEAAAGADRTTTLERTAASLGITAEALAAALFADLPGERVVVGLAQPPSPGALALKANLWLAQAWLSRASRVRLDVKGASRLLVLNAKSKGLLCTITGSADGSAAALELSGPLSLFKKTRLYGRSLAALLPALAWCDRWVLVADCVFASRHVEFRLSTGAPIQPSEPPQRFDSRIEERFARDFEKKKRSWRLVREPRPLVAGDGLVFPDFALEPVDGGPDARPVFVELVGFWTPAYLEEKLARYRLARLRELVLCVDEGLGCSDGDIPAHARVVRFKRRVDVDAVLTTAATLGP